MSTPYMILAGWGKSITISMWVIWVSTLILSRVYAFHEAYISESQRLMDEKYLLEKCQDPEFYSNIRQHTGICAEVETNARSNIILKALNIMAQGTHMCGVHSCAETLRLVIGRLTWQGIGVLALVALVFPNALLVAARAMGFRRHLVLESGVMRRHAMDGVVCYRRDTSSNAPFYCDMQSDLHMSENDEENTQELEASSLRRRFNPSGKKNQNNIKIV